MRLTGRVLAGVVEIVEAPGGFRPSRWDDKPSSPRVVDRIECSDEYRSEMLAYIWNCRQLKRASIETWAIVRRLSAVSSS